MNRNVSALATFFRLDGLMSSTLYNLTLEAVSIAEVIDGDSLQSRSSPSFLRISTSEIFAAIKAKRILS